MVAKKSSTAEMLIEENQSFLELLHENPFFKKINDRLINILRPLIKICDFAEGTIILNQGEINTVLYILIEGHLGVYRDNEFIVRLKRMGDLVGEMGLITSKPCSATIKAVTKVKMFAIDCRELSKMPQDQVDFIQQNLHQVYSAILAEKLEVTNLKAKQFEQTNLQLQQAQEELKKYNEMLEQKVQERTQELTKKTDELFDTNKSLEQKNVEVKATYQKIEELMAAKESTLQKIHDFNTRPLDDILDAIDKYKVTLPQELQKSILEARHEIRYFLDFIAPMKAHYQNEMALKSKKILLIETNKKQQVVAKLALGGTGLELDICDNLEDGFSKIESFYDVIFIGADALEIGVKALEKYPQTNIVFMTSQSVAQEILHLNNYPQITNIVARDLEDRAFTVKSILSTVTKIINQDYFGLEKYMNVGVEVQEIKIGKSSERKNVNQAVTDYFSGLGVRQSSLVNVTTVLEEMLMNAIYDAPTDRNGKSLFNHLSRQDEVILHTHQQAIVRYACDGVNLAVSVIDPFGSLSREILFRYLENCYRGNKDRPDETKGGAGKGLHLIMECSDLVIFNIRPRLKTEVIAIFNLERNKNKETFGSSFHYFKITSPEKI